MAPDEARRQVRHWLNWPGADDGSCPIPHRAIALLAEEPIGLSVTGESDLTDEWALERLAAARVDNDAGYGAELRCALRAIKAAYVDADALSLPISGDVEARARELLADEYRKDSPQSAMAVLAGNGGFDRALAAIRVALSTPSDGWLEIGSADIAASPRKVVDLWVVHTSCTGRVSGERSVNCAYYRESATHAEGWHDQWGNKIEWTIDPDKIEKGCVANEGRVVTHFRPLPASPITPEPGK